MTTIGVFSAIFDDQQRVLCVRRAYGPLNWTTPGGRLEPGETPPQTLVREVAEETGYQVVAGRLIGLYAIPQRDDLVISMEARIIGRGAWQANEEIAECDFFDVAALPQPMHPATQQRIRDAAEKQYGVMRIIP